jgi:sec-independent protein translocase protein TatB
VFDVHPTELLLLGAVAIAVIPPKDLPRAMRFAGQWIGKARGMARHFRTGLDEMIRQAELDEIEKKWREENERIMREHPLHDAIEHPIDEPVMTALPAPAGETPNYPVPTAQEDADSPIEPIHDTAPLTAENGTELPPAVPEGNAQAKARRAAKPAADPIVVAEGDGPELPLGLPPKS